MGLSRRKLTKEYKKRPSGGWGWGTIAEVARACEVNPDVLHHWRRKLRNYDAKAFAGNGLRRVDESRVPELERTVSAGNRFFAQMFAACRGGAEAAGVDYARVVTRASRKK
jgi:transposase-like protein